MLTSLYAAEEDKVRTGKEPKQSGARIYSNIKGVFVVPRLIIAFLCA